MSYLCEEIKHGECAMIQREIIGDFHSKLKHSFLKSEEKNPK